MTNPNQQQTTPPAWYPDPDPANPGGQRWWDGLRWTEHARPGVPAAQPIGGGQPVVGGTPAIGSPANVAAAQPVYPTQGVSAQLPGIPPTAYAQAPYGQTPYGQQSLQTPYGQAAYQPAYPQQPIPLPPVAPGTSSLTLHIWFIVGLPLLSAIAFLFVDLTSYLRTVVEVSTSGASPEPGDLDRVASSFSGTFGSILLVQLLSIVIFGLSVMFAYFDQRDLQRRGFARPFHWAWAFLGGIVYVIGRTVVAKRRGGALALWPIWGLIAVVVITAVIYTVKFVIVFSSIADAVSSFGPGATA